VGQGDQTSLVLTPFELFPSEVQETDITQAHCLGQMTGTRTGIQDQPLPVQPGTKKRCQGLAVYLLIQPFKEKTPFSSIK